MDESVTIIDFWDSFTYNIACEVYALGLTCKVISWQEVDIYLQKIDSEKRHVFILGPGPGHPQDYCTIFNVLSSILDNENFFCMGICLGHQIMALLKGGIIRRSSWPVHGQKQLFTIPQWPKIFDQNHIGQKVLVQRYNSLEVVVDYHRNDRNSSVLGENHECLADYGERGVSYQFHPESIGTSCPSLFFAVLKKFYYNNWDGESTVSH